MLPLHVNTFVSMTFVVMIAFFSTGCHTLANLQGKEHILISAPGERRPQVYGGVIRSFEELNEVTPTFFPNSQISLDTIYLPLYFALMTVDTSASAIADTVTIPIVLFRQKKWDVEKHPSPDKILNVDWTNSDPPIPGKDE